MANAAPTLLPIEGGPERNAWSQPLTIALTNSISTTGVIPYARFRGGTFTLPTGLTATSFTFYSRAVAGGSLKAHYTDEATPVAVTRTVAADRSYPIPDALVGAFEIAIVSNVAGPETIEVNLKSA